MESIDKIAQDQLIEQYKLYVEMADRVSQRRVKLNQFYTTVLLGLLIAIAFKFNNGIYGSIASDQVPIFLVLSLLGNILCIVWQVNIHSYRQLNAKKFEVIHEIEKSLPFAAYDREWELLGKGKDAKLYFQLTRVEKFVPLILLGPYLILTIYGIYAV